jgi:CDP-diacylglycerol--inositol 3-phosphatidyltransferase
MAENKDEAAATAIDSFKTDNVYLFVPNLIGYSRVFLALLSFWFMPTNCYAAGFCYLLSGLLDAVDGHAARLLNQSSKFGAMLDMLTDRCATMCLLATLCIFYPSATILFQISMSIDISSHWIHMHTALLKGKTSHKFMDSSSHPILKLYYTNRQVLFCMCAGNELFYVSLYLLNFASGFFYYVIVLLAVLMAPVAIVKLGLALIQGYEAWYNLGQIDMAERKAESESAKQK